MFWQTEKEVKANVYNDQKQFFKVAGKFFLYMATWNANNKTKADEHNLNDSNDTKYNSLNLNASRGIANDGRQQLSSTNHRSGRNAFQGYGDIAENRKKNFVVKDEPRNRLRGLPLPLNYYDSDGEEKDEKKMKKAKSSLNNSTLSLHILKYEQSIDSGDKGLQNEDKATGTSSTKSITKGIGGFFKTCKDILLCNDVSNNDKKTEEKLPIVQHFRASEKLFDPNKQPVVHHCDRCFKFFNLFREYLLHECPEANDIVPTDSPCNINVQHTEYNRYVDEETESKAIVETVYEKYVPPAEYHLYSRNVIVEEPKNVKEGEIKKKNKDLNDKKKAVNETENFLEETTVAEAPVAETLKTSEIKSDSKNVVVQNHAKFPKSNQKPVKLIGSSSLWNNPDCCKIMNRYATAKKNSGTFTTLAADLSEVLGFAITRFQANHQYKLYLRKISFTPPILKQTKLNFQSAKKSAETKQTLKRKASATVESGDVKVSKKKGKDVHEEVLHRMQNLEEQNEQILIQNTEIFNLLKVFMDNANINGNGSISRKILNSKNVTFKEKSESIDLEDDPESDIKIIESETSESDTNDGFTDDGESEGSYDDSEEEDDDDYMDDTNIASTSDYSNHAPVVNKSGQILTDYMTAKNSKLKPMVVVMQNRKIYSYTKKNTNPPTTYYECNRCPRNSTDKSKGTLKGDQFWAHPGHSEECQPMTQKEFDELQIDRNIRENVTKGFRGIDAYRAGFKEACAKGLNIGDYENLRKSYDRLSGKEIPNSLKNKVAAEHTVLLSGERWLLHEEKDLAVFSSDLELRTMAECKILMADPTFRTSPKGFNQTLYIHGLVEGQSGPEWRCLLMAVMNNREEITYKIVFNAIKKRWKEMGVEPKFERFHTDYESALFNAAAELGGKDKVYENWII
uniref:Uncharacterized protein n=1 Tax=Panagrolaimus superbus TaxID=310955 RepID=A0A914XZI4_9BILA